MKFKRL